MKTPDHVVRIDKEAYYLVKAKAEAKENESFNMLLRRILGMMPPRRRGPHKEDKLVTG